MAEVAHPAASDAAVLERLRAGDEAVFAALVARHYATMPAVAQFWSDVPRFMHAFRSGDGIPWGDHHPSMFCGTERFFRTGYQAHLAAEWIPRSTTLSPSSSAAAASPTSGAGTACLRS